MREAWRVFCRGRRYAVFATLLIFLGYATGWTVLFGGMLVLMLALSALVSTDLRFLMLPLAGGYLMISRDLQTGKDYYLQPYVTVAGAVAAAVLLYALTVFCIRNRKRIRKPKKSLLLLSLIIFSVSLIPNGLFSDFYTQADLLYPIAMILPLLGIYLLFSAYSDFDDDTGEYLLFTLCAVGSLICAELLLGYATKFQFTDGRVVKESVMLGWGIWTAIGGMLAFLMPACFYFAAEKKRGWIGYLLGIFFYFCILLSQARGALLVGGAVLVLSLVALCFFGKYKKRNRIFLLFLLFFGGLVGVLFFGKFMKIFENFLSYGLKDNGRFDLWLTGLENFRKYPIFGAGFYAVSDEIWNKQIYPWFYHNTPVQMLAASGLFGFFAYLFHRVATLRIFFRKPSVFKLFSGLCVLALLCESLIDVLFFDTYPTLIYTLLLLACEQTTSLSK